MTVSKLVFLSPLLHGATHQPSLCIMSPQAAYVRLHDQKHTHTRLSDNSSSVRGDLGSLGCFLQWTHTWPSLLTIPLPSLVGPEVSCPWPPSTESPETKASHRPPTPMQPCPWLPSGNLGTGLGSQTEDALRARAQSWRSFLSAMKGRTVLRLNTSGWRGVRAQRPHWSAVQAALCKAS